jgi:hypothetical protein
MPKQTVKAIPLNKPRERKLLNAVQTKTLWTRVTFVSLRCINELLLYGGYSNGVLQIHFFQAEHKIQFRSRPMRFLGFSSHEHGAQRQEISKWSEVCSTFTRSRWCFVRSASLAKRDTSKKRPSPHLHKVPTRSNKVSPRTFQMALVYSVEREVKCKGKGKVAVL